MNVALIEQNKIIKKDGNLGSFTHEFIPANSPKFKGYEFYMQENKRLEKKGSKSRYKFLPCGKCIGCKAAERKNWAIRLELEAKKYENNYFITLTYNNENLKIPDHYGYTIENKEYPLTSTTYVYTNENNWRDWRGTLDKKDLSRFMDSFRHYLIRKYNWTGCRFYGVGEYGDRYGRPHYHIILMNCPQLQLEPRGQNLKTRLPKYTNKEIEHVWGKGFIEIGEVTWESISYVAGYCNKKRYGNDKKKYYGERGQEPIFANMSRRPGIGKEYYNLKGYDIYDFDEIINSKGNPVKPPRYFDKLMDKENHYFMEYIKEAREKKTQEEIEKKLKLTSLNLEQQLKIDEKTAIIKQQRYNRERIK